MTHSTGTKGLRFFFLYSTVFTLNVNLRILAILYAMPWFVLRRVVKKRKVVRRRRRTRSTTSKLVYKAASPVARLLAHERLTHFNQHYGYTYQKVFIRNTHTRWGTCSSRGNISFNWRIVNLSPALQDYVVVHELCHLKQLNHSPAFWTLVSETIPDWKARRQALKKYSLA
jgi:predicted metal-dependent hydrolase